MKRLLIDKCIDVLDFQEANLSYYESIEKYFEPFLLEYEACVSQSVGTSVEWFLFNKTLPLTELTLTTDIKGRFTVCDLHALGTDTRIFCVYAPNYIRERVLFFILVSFLETDCAVILLGHFIFASAASDRPHINVHVEQSSNVLEERVGRHELVDVATLNLISGSLKYSHFQGTSHARLDRIYIHFSLVSRIMKYFVKSS